MIKVNLLPARRARKAASATDPTAKQFGAGVAAVLAAGAAVFFLVDMPKRAKLSELAAANQALDQQIADKNRQLQGYGELKKAEEEANRRAAAIEGLLQNKVVPAYVMHEIGKILTAEGPTMSEEMVRLAGNGIDSDPNKRFQVDWDPKHVWLLSFVDSGGSFRIEGGAQSESDVTQLAKRLDASVFFWDISPSGGERVTDTVNGVNYYRFQITGRMAY
jgi:type IV pilus assembly protein PilN